MKNWVNRALGLIKASLEQPKHELNELDWKAALSPDKKRLAEHLSALANYPGGGFLVYGVDASGIPHAVTEEVVQTTINQLANIGRQGIEPSVSLDHAVENYDSVPLLFVLHSRTPRWEELHASILLTDAELLSKLNIEPILKMMDRPIPTTNEERLNWMTAEGFISREPAGGGYVTNLGAIAAARRLVDFPDIARKAVRIVVYDGLNKSKTKREQEGAFGYAIGFQGIIQFLASLLPQSEVIEKALRVERTVYPEIALRELVANALIHQDFSVSGVSPLIEIFDDRIEISNPGGLLPSKQLDRLIGTQPESRNEKLASAFRRYKICEERGSGLIKAGQAVELYGLPPMEFYSGPNYFKVTLYSPRTFAQMSARERLEACYQHAELKYFSDSAMTNKSLRERLKMPEKQRSMVSNLIQEAISLKRIKPANPDNKSKKFTEYVPFWA